MRETAPPLKESPSQTAGPYVQIGLLPNVAGITGVYPVDLGRDLVNAETRGERIIIEGCVIDGSGEPVRDCLIEIWQADATGLYNSPLETRGAADPNFTGWGRSPVDPETGLFRFETIKPGRVPFPDGRLQAPHISLWIVARGINLGLNTRLYFADETEANATDPVLAGVSGRASTLIAERQGNNAYHLDIRLQGDNETVFFDV
jgi:protocatechuate 3,4-dioxygenase alpha subunit